MMSKKSGAILVLAGCVVAPFLAITGYKLVELCKKKKSAKTTEETAEETTEESESENV